MVIALSGTDVINVASAGNQENVKLAALAGGGYVAVWFSASTGSVPAAIYAQTYNEFGQRAGVPTLITSGSLGSNELSVAGLADGGFAVTWIPQSSSQLATARFDANAVQQGDTFVESTTSTVYQGETLALSDGGYLVISSQRDPSNGDWDIFGQRFNADGTVNGAAYNITATSPGQEYVPAADVLANGDVVTAYYGAGGQLFTVTHSVDGATIGAPVQISTSSVDFVPHSVLAMPGGGYVIAWAENAIDGSGQGIAVQIFDATGTSVAGPFVANETTSSTQQQPDLALLADGGFMVTWYNATTTQGTSTSVDVLGRSYDADGTAREGEFLLSDALNGAQSDPDVIVLANGNIVAAWETSGSDGDGNGRAVVQRVFGPDGTTVVLPTSPIVEGLAPVQNVSEADLNAGGVRIDSNMAAAVSGPADFDGGRLIVTRRDLDALEANLPNELFDRALQSVRVENVGSGTGEIGVSGFDVTFGGTIIGVITSDGQGGADLVIEFNSDATPQAVEAVVEHLVYADGSDDPEGVVELVIALEDGDGGAADPAVVVLNVTSEVDALEAIGDETRVNSFTSSTQSASDVATLADGGWVVVWQSSGQDQLGSSQAGIYAQRFNADGQPVGQEFLVNTQTSGSQVEPAVAALSTGGWVVSWNDQTISGGVTAQVFGADGAMIGGEIVVPTTFFSTQSSPAIAEIPGGGFYIAWQANVSGAGNEIKVQRFDSDGTKNGPEIIANADAPGNQDVADIVALSGGGFAVSFNNFTSGVTNSTDVYVRVFDDTGTPVSGDIRVNTQTSSVQDDSAIAALADGGFVVTWSDSSGADGSSQGIFAQRFDDMGAAVGGEFQVNEFSNSQQYQSDAVGLPGGGFAIAWTSFNSKQGFSSYDVFVQFYDANGDRIDSEILVNTANLSSTQAEPAMTALPSGDVVISFSDNSSAASNGSDVWQQIIGNPANFPAPENKPVIEVAFDDITFDENAGAEILLPGAAVGDLDSADFDGGTFSVTRILSNTFDELFNTPDDSTQDLLGIADAGGITVSGTDVSFGGTVIGTVTQDGTDGRLDVALNANATPEAVEALAQAVTYQNLSDDPAVERILRVQLSDGDGGFADPQFVTVNVTPTPDILEPVSGEVQVNSFTRGSQADSSVAVLTDGKVAVTWTSDDQDGSAQGVYGQLFSANGTPIGSERLVTTDTASTQSESAVAALSDGGGVIVWYSANTSGVRAQLFNSDGTDRGTEFSVETTTSSTQSQPQVVGYDGGFAVVWVDFGVTSGDIRLQRFDNSGAAVGTETLINATTASRQDRPEISSDAQGNLSIVWIDQSGSDGSAWGTYLRTVAADGTLGTETLVPQSTTNSQYNPVVETLPDGRVVVVWMDDNSVDGSGLSVQGRILQADGTPLGDQFLVNDFTASSQSDPDIAVLPDGGFAVVFAGNGPGDGSGIFVQEYTSAGARKDGARLVNEQTASTQSQPKIEATATGYVVTWTSATSGAAGDGSSNGIFMRTFDNGSGPAQVADLRPVLDGLSTGISVAGDDGNASTFIPEVLVDNALDISDPDDGFDGGTFLASFYGTGASSNDQLSILPGLNVTVSGNDVAFDGTVVATIDGTQNGVNGADLLLTFNSAVTDDAVQAIAERLAYASTTFSNFSSRDITIAVTDAGGLQSNAQTVSVQHRTSVSLPTISLTDADTPQTFTEAEIQAGIRLDGSVDFEHGGAAPLEGGFLTVSKFHSQFDPLTETIFVHDDGTGTGQISVSGSDISFEGTQFATIDATQSGEAGANLRIDFGAGTTAEAVDALIEALGFRNDGEWQNGSYSLQVQVRDSANASASRTIAFTAPQDTTGDLAPLTDDDLVNSFVTGSQNQPSAAALADGGYVVVWTTNNQSGVFQNDIYGQRYDSNGETVGTEFAITDILNGVNESEPVVAGLTGGGFATAWVANSEIGLRTFDAAGDPLTEVVIANDQTSSTQTRPDITALSNGNFLVAWASSTSGGAGDGSSTGVIGRLFQADGTPVSDTAGNDDIILNPTTASTQDYVSVAPNGTGGFVAVWWNGNDQDIRAQRYDDTGAREGSEIIVSTSPPSSSSQSAVAQTSDGGFVVVWTAPDGSGTGLFQQKFNASGTPEGGNMLVNEVTSSTQSTPSVTATDAGWIVSWNDSSGRFDNSSTGIVAQAFDLTGAQQGDPFRVTSQQVNQQFDSTLVTLADGRIAAVWTGSQGANQPDVYTTLIGDPLSDPIPSMDPAIAGLGDVTLDETAVNAGPVSIVQAGTVAVEDLDSSTFDGGRLTLATLTTFDARLQFKDSDGTAQDNISFAGPGISLAGGNVSVGGTVIGTLESDGQAGADLSVNLTANATPERIEALLDSLVYTNMSNDPDAARTYGVTLTDGQGGVSENAEITINIAPETDGAEAIEGELQANTNFRSTQSDSTVAALSGGGHVVVWQSLDQDNPGDANWGVFAQRFDENGQRDGLEFQVNSTFVGRQYEPDVVGLSDGGFVIVWEGFNGSTTGIIAQRYDANGVAQGSEFRVNSVDLSELDPRLAATDDGFAVLWEGSNNIIFRAYDNAGNALTADVNLTSTQAFSEFQPTIAGLADGRYVVSYSYNGGNLASDTSSNGVYAQVVNADGTVSIAEFLVNTDTLNSESDPAVAALADGGFAIVWTAGSGQDSSADGVYGQIYNSDGSPRGNEFLVNEQISSSQYDPSITALADGGFVVTFDDNSGRDGSGLGVFAQQYDAQGNRIDGQLLVNEHITSSQFNSDVAGLSNGGFAVSWTSVTNGAAGDGDGQGIFTRVFGSPADYNITDRPVIEGFNETVTFDENDVNGGFQRLDVNGAVALSDANSSDFDGGFLRIDTVVADRGFANQFNAPDDITQNILGLIAENGVMVSGADVSVDGTVIGTLAEAGPTLLINFGPDATIGLVERVLENIGYRNASDDPSDVRLLQIQVDDGDAGRSNLLTVEVTVTPQVDGVVPLFTERQANTTTESTQEDPAVAQTDEGFVIVWRSFNQEDSAANTYGIFGQRFDAVGNPIGSEFQVNTTEAGSQGDPQVVGISGGGFAVTWTDPTSPNGQDIFIQRFNADGTLNGSETQINTAAASTERDPEVIELADGTLLFAWDSFASGIAGRSSYDVIAQVFDPATGATVGGELLLNSQISGTQRDIHLAATADGGFIATWVTDDATADGDGSAIMARQFGGAASGFAPAGAEFLVNSVTSGAQSNPAVAVLTDGRYVITWQDPAADGSSSGVFAQLYNSDGSTVGGQFRVADERLGSEVDPAILALTDGGFAIAYSDNSNPIGSGTDVYLQQYDAQGNRVDGGLRVNTEIQSTQQRPEIAEIADGTFVVAYESQSSGPAGDGSSTGIFYQLFDQVDPPITDLNVETEEDTTLVFALDAFDNALEGDLQAVRIDVVPVTGEILLNGIAVSGGEEVSRQELIDGDLTYRPAEDFNGFDSFFWSGSTDGVTFELVQTEGVVEITPVNDPVDLQAVPDQVIGERTFTNFNLQLAIGDPDSSDIYTITVDYGEGNPATVFNTGSRTPNISNFYEAEGDYTVSVTVDDNAGSVEMISFDVTVNNVAPDARNEFYSTDEDTAITNRNVLGNDSDPGNDPITITAINGQPYTPGDDVVLPSGATVSIASDGTLNYDPTTSTTLQNQTDGQFTDDIFTYSIEDDAGLTDTASVSVRVTGEDDFAAEDDDLGVDEKSLLTGSLLDDNGNGEDTDPEGDAISITSINGNPALVGAPVVLAGGGVLTVEANGDFTFDPRGEYIELGVGETRVLSFTYGAVEAGEGATASATATITIDGLNDAPVANDNFVTTGFETPTSAVNLLGNDFDPDGDMISLQSIDPAANGSIQVNGDTVTYTPDAGFFGDDIVTYTIVDENGATDTASVTFRVSAPVNTSPVANDDSVTVDEDVPTLIDALGNDTDADGDSLSISSLFAISGGTVRIVGNQFEFTSDADYNGPASFSYGISDGNGGSDTATVSISVEPVNDAPVATDDVGFSADFDTAVNIDVADLLSNDEDGDPEVAQPLSVASVGNAQNGVVSLANGIVTFTPTAGFSGTAQFDYTLSDGNGGTDTATVFIDVGDQPNRAPIANDDTVETNEDTAILFNILGNDTDLDGDPIEVNEVRDSDGNIIPFDTATDLPEGGTITVARDGSASYDPDGDFESLPGNPAPADPLESLTLTYNLIEDTDETLVSADATVTIDLRGVNDAPVAADDALVTDEDSSLTGDLLGDNGAGADSDTDQGDTLTIVAVNGETTTVNGQIALASGALLTVNGDGSFAYDPNGQFEALAIGDSDTESFTYTIDDGNGGTDTATATITVNGVNDGPVANNDAYNTDEDTALTIGNVLDNDTDVDIADVLTVASIDTTGTLGSVIDNGDGTFGYDPNGQFETLAAGESTTDSFVYTVSDGNGGMETAEVTVTINGVNDAPAADDFDVTTDEDTAVILPVLANISDIDGDTLALSFTVDSALGAVSFDGTNYIFTPAADVNGDIDIAYEVDDSNGGVATGTISVTVNAVNDAPTATDDSGFSTMFGTELTIDPADLLANDEDGDPEVNQPLSITDVTDGIGGSVEIVDEQILFTPDAGFAGTATFTYEISDGNGGTDTATVTVNVGDNAPPQPGDVSAILTEDDATTALDLLDGATDADGDSLMAVNVMLSADDGRDLTGIASVSGNSVSVTPMGNFEALNAGESVVITVDYNITDGVASVATSAEITINGVNDAPLLDAAGPFTIEENTTAVGTLTASDLDDSLLSFSISGGADAALFEITSDGALSFISAPDYEAPLDTGGVDGDNIYEVEVTVSDGALSDSQLVSVTVSDVDEEPILNEILGTSGSDYLIGTDGADAIRSLGGRYDRMRGGEDADQFIFGSEANNGARERDVILDYEVGVDVIVLEDGAEIASIRDSRGGATIFLEGDRDAIYVRGDGVTADNLSIVSDDVFEIV